MASQSAGARYAPSRPASIFATTRPQEGASIFGEDLISEKSLDEVILSYLAEDSGWAGREEVAMPEEIEVPTEHLHETLHEHAHAAGGEHATHGGEASPPPWVSQVALSAAVLAVGAAVAALLAGHHANEAIIEQMKATDAWALYQAKGIKGSLAEQKVELLAALGKEAKEDDKAKLERYREEQKEIKKEADEEERSSKEHMRRHGVLARSVTTYQIAIALSAIAVLSRRKVLWFAGLVLGVGGTIFLGLALL